MKLPEAMEAINDCLDADVPPFVWGTYGIGKSEGVAAVAKARGALFADIRLSMFDPVDLRGLPAIVDGKTVWLRPGVWPVDESRETVLFFDELDRASTSVLNAALQIVLDRKIGEHKLPDACRIVAAGNGATDKGTTTKTGAALDSRFLHLNVEPDAEAWAQWALVNGIDPALIAFIRFRPGMIHGSTMADGNGKPIAADTKGGKGSPTPRGWERVNRFMGKPDVSRHRLVTGLVGEHVAGEFEAFVRTMRQLPSLATILADPHGADVPADPSARFAVSAALARRADASNFAAVLAYAGRLPREFEVITAIDATRRDPALVQTAAYVGWAVANAEVLS